MSKVTIPTNTFVQSAFDFGSVPDLKTATKKVIVSAKKLQDKASDKKVFWKNLAMKKRKKLFKKVLPKLRAITTSLNAAKADAIVEAATPNNISVNSEVLVIQDKMREINKSLPTLSKGLARFAKIELSQLKAELIKLHKGTDTLPSEDTIITHCDEIDMDALDEAEELRAINKLKGTEASDILEKSIKGKTYDSIKEYDLEDDLEDEIIEAKAPELSHEMKDKVVATAMNSDLSGIALFKSIVDEVLPSSILGYLQPFDKVKMTATLAHIRISFNSNKALDHDTFPAFFDVQESIKQRFLVLVNILSDVQAKKIAA